MTGCQDSGEGTNTDTAKTDGTSTTGPGGGSKDNNKEPSDPPMIDGEFVYSGHTPVWLDQGWTHDESIEFYYRDQGSELVPYEWFLALEKADSEELFRSDEHMVALGYITQSASTKNPDALPVGFVRDEDAAAFSVKEKSLGTEFNAADYPKTLRWLGLTCAACHTADITYNKNVIRIDGGPAMVDHESLLTELAAAMRATCSDDAKFERFRKRNSNDENNDTTTLRAELETFTKYMEMLVERNRAEHAYGFARLDAFGAIVNEITEAALGIPENRRVSDAPVSFPFLWYAPSLDHVQWNRSADVAIARNVGEVMGVYGQMDLQGTPETGQFQTTANVTGLARLEDLVSKLKAPEWPATIFGDIDQEKVQRGAGLFAQNCASCHPVRDEQGKFPMTEPNAVGIQFIKTLSVTPTSIGTDPKMVENFLNRKAKPGDLKPYLPEALRQLEEVPAVYVLGAAVGGVVERYQKENGLDQQQMLALAGGHIRDLSLKFDGYISRPLYGIWATAPYLHNGSVPNLYELLLPEEKRSKSFYVGSREYDPKNVGFVTTKSEERSFELVTQSADGTPIPGNSNKGHTGPANTQKKGDDGKYRDFTDDEIWDLIEYMKTLK